MRERAPPCHRCPQSIAQRLRFLAGFHLGRQPGRSAVPPGGFYVYEFMAKETGTYWYHSHQDTSNQLARGLIGSIVVEPKQASAANVRDYSLLVHSQAGTDAIAINGTSNLHLDASPGDTVRLRITNAVVPGFDGASASDEHHTSSCLPFPSKRKDRDSARALLLMASVPGLPSSPLTSEGRASSRPEVHRV